MDTTKGEGNASAEKPQPPTVNKNFQFNITGKMNWKDPKSVGSLILIFIVALIFFRIMIPIFKNQNLPAQQPQASQETGDEVKSDEKTLEYQLANINSGGNVKNDDVTVNRFRFLLERINSKTVNTKQEISDITVRGWQLLKADYGKEVSLLEFMEQANDSIPTGQQKAEYRDFVSLLIVMLGESK